MPKGYPQDPAKRSKGVHRLVTGSHVEKLAPVQMRQARGNGEADVQHAGFLLWAMQTPGRRNRNAVARLIDRTKTTVKQWFVRYRWEERADFPDAEYWAGRLLNALYPALLLQSVSELPELERLQELIEHGVPEDTDLDGMADVDLSMDPTEAPTGADGKEAGPRKSTISDEIEKALPERGNAEVRAVKKVARAIIKQTGTRVMREDVDLGMKDFYASAKLLLALEGMPNEMAAHQEGGGAAKESVRVRLVQSSNGTPLDILRARRDDLLEVMTVIDQMILQHQVDEMRREETTPRIAEAGKSTGSVLNFPDPGAKE